MGKVIGIGGVFFKAEDPDRLRGWYRQHLGIECNDSGAADFQWRQVDAPTRGRTVWAPFPRETNYFAPGKKEFMINYVVENLDELIKELRNAGVAVDDRIEEYEYGRFAWAMDPEGNRIELWEPAGE